MTLLLAWVLFPIVLGLICLGCGLLLRRVGGSHLPGPLLLPAGFAVVIVTASLATQSGRTASLATPAVVAFGIMGLGLSFPWKRATEAWAFVGAGGAFAAYAAPIVLSGQATFAGYIKLDDTATWLAIADRTIGHGRSLAGLAASSYQARLNEYIGQTGYPVGSVAPLGVSHQLVRVDAAWLFQPYLAFQAALLALVLYTSVGRLIRSPWARALVAFVAAQATLLYGYALWGSVKELVTVPLIALLAVLVASLFRAPVRLLTAVPLAVTSAALLAVLNVGGGVWLGLALLPTLALAFRLPLLSFAVRAAIFSGLTLVLSLPTLQTSRSFYGPASHTLTSGAELGNLKGPLSRLQLFGIWLKGDFRDRPHDLTVTYILIAVVAAAALVALAAAVWKRAGELLLYAAVSVVGYLLLARVGSPWVDAKALATASPAPVAAGMAAAAFIFERGRRVEGAVVAAAIAGGVLWSNALAYHVVWLAPHARLAELERIGHRFSGDGPTLTTDAELYGVRYFLRGMDPDGVGIYGSRSAVQIYGGENVDVDRLGLDSLLVYRTLVLRRSPVASRPPSAFALVWQGRYYEVWQHSAGAPRILRHLPLGSSNQASSTPNCKDVLRLAALATRSGGRLTTVIRPAAVVKALGSPALDVDLTGRFRLSTAVDIPAAGRYGVWIGGSFRARLEVSIDGRRVGVARYHLEHQGNFILLGYMSLGVGRHEIAIDYSGPDVIHPGSGGDPVTTTGPLVIAPGTADRPVQYVQPQNARTLCGKSLDWVEAVAP
jgi:hypothetical protein